jgi:6-phosphogluconate dehydrogenase
VTLDSPRWRGVAIYLEGGKMMPEGKAEVAVTFRHPQPCLCPPNLHQRNVLRYEIQPEAGFKTSFWVKRPGSEMVLEEKDFLLDYQNAYAKDLFLEPYEKLIQDALRGNQTLFVSTGEVVRSWQFIDPILKTWQEKKFPLHHYASKQDLEAITLEDNVRHDRTIGYVGLGKMGFNMATRLIRHGWGVHATDVDPEPVKKAEAMGARGYGNLKDLVAALPSPRVIWLMIPSTDPAPVNDALFGEDGLASLLEPGDIVIDGGNSLYKYAIERGRKLAERGISFLDIGTSGGPAGALQGACLMIGGPQEAYRALEPLFRDLAAPGAYAYCGPSGGGHFVKMVHNGIEYGMMQALAEGFEILKKSEFAPDLPAVADLYNHRSVIESRLVGWLVDAYAKFGPDLEGISGEVGHTGEGEWTVNAGKELGVPTPVIADSFRFRVDSKGNPSYTGQVLSALRLMFGGHTDAKAKPAEGSK